MLIQSSQSNKWYHQNRWHICEDCTFVFQTHSHFTGNNVFCPNCGECIHVVRYTAERTSPQRKRLDWKTEEENTLRDLNKEGLLPHQMAIILGRSTGSVREKLRRMGLWKRRTIG